jgi:amino-acid N-acetyltransferase
LTISCLREHLATTLVARDRGRVVATAAVEIYADGALLRSVAVDGPAQGRGLGRFIAEAAIDLARARHAPAVFLLTTTAEAYFPALGFERIRRDAVPASVQTSVDFTSACPSGATVMRKPLSMTPE